VTHTVESESPEAPSVGTQRRQRLNRALHMILVTRRRSHLPTIAYIEGRVQEGKSRREATRCLKRYLARNLYRLLEHGQPLAT
jgi:hypothetical protein